MNIINATPHTLNILDNNNTVLLVIPASGIVARCTVQRELMEMLDGIPVNKTVFGELTGLPEEASDTMYVVSALAAQAGKAQGRDDLLVTDDAVRDDTGKIVGCRALARI